MKKPVSKKKLVKAIDSLCKQIVYIRDGGRCQKCKKPVSGKNAHTSHVIPKSRGLALRFDLLNLKLLCFYCHIQWWHKNPIEAAAWFKEKFPFRFEYLQVLKNKMVKMSLQDYQDLKERMESVLKNTIKREGVPDGNEAGN